MTDLDKIESLYKQINNSVFTINPTMDYAEITDAIIELCGLITDLPQSKFEQEWFYFGEYTDACLFDFIVGAYWHFTEWHGGQSSPGYAVLSALGRIFSPGVTAGCKPESGEQSVYEQLDLLALKANGLWRIAGYIDPTDKLQLYWSNSDGWVDIGSADIYTDAEKPGFLPIGGQCVNG